jgi:hypothetical protein
VREITSKAAVTSTKNAIKTPCKRRVDAVSAASAMPPVYGAPAVP